MGLAACIAMPVAAFAARKALMDEEMAAREEAWWGGAAPAAPRNRARGHFGPILDVRPVRGILDPPHPESEDARRAAAPKSVTEAGDDPARADGVETVEAEAAWVHSDEEGDIEDAEHGKNGEANRRVDGDMDREDGDEGAAAGAGWARGDEGGSPSSRGVTDDADEGVADPPEPKASDVFRVLGELEDLSKRLGQGGGVIPGEDSAELARLVRLLATGVFELSRAKDEELEHAVVRAHARGEVALRTAEGVLEGILEAANEHAAQLEAGLLQAKLDADMARSLSAQAGDDCEAAMMSAQMAIDEAEANAVWRVEATAGAVAAEAAQ